MALQLEYLIRIFSDPSLYVGSTNANYVRNLFFHFNESLKIAYNIDKRIGKLI